MDSSSSSSSPSAGPPGSGNTMVVNCLFGATLAERQACRNACTLETCPLQLSYWDYRPNVPLNIAFFVISILLCLLLLVQGIRWKGFKRYTVVICIGLLMQALGYASRIYANSHPFSDISFIMQLTCLTLAPVFFAAGIYFSLSRIIITIGEGNSRIQPKKIPRIFISFDFLCLLLQAAGGAISSWRALHELMPDPGNYTVIAGLSLQSLTLMCFLGLSIDFRRRVNKAAKQYGSAAFNEDLDAQQIRKSKRFRGLLISLSACAILIFARSIYRIAEMSEGWKGPLMGTEVYVMCFDAVPIAIAGFMLAGFHPAFCFRDPGRPAAPQSRSSTPPASDGETIFIDSEKFGELSYEKSGSVVVNAPRPWSPKQQSGDTDTAAKDRTESSASSV